MVRTYYLTPDRNSKLIVDVTKKSDNTSTNSQPKEDPAEIHVSSDDFPDSMVYVSEHVEKYGENLSGSYYSKI